MSETTVISGPEQTVFSADQWRRLDPRAKVAIIEAMGFTPGSSEHDRRCPAWTEFDGDHNGMICNCAGEPTTWSAPKDVQIERRETWEQRVRDRQERRYPGSDPGRQMVGLPGHCDACADLGHVQAHPDLGCSDVGCNQSHEG